MLTVSEIARDLNVSVQAIYKKINKSMKNELRSHIKIINGQKLIDEEGTELLKNSFKPTLNGSEPINTHIIKNENVTVLNCLELDLTIKENDSLKEQIKILKESNIVLESVLNQFKTVQSEEILFLRKRITELEQEKEQTITILEREQEYGKQQSDRISDLAEKLVELTRNSQVLLKQEQEKNTFLFPEQVEILNDSCKKLKRPFWRFWKK